jgi:hypothetical protein
MLCFEFELDSCTQRFLKCVLHVGVMPPISMTLVGIGLLIGVPPELSVMTTFPRVIDVV